MTTAAKEKPARKARVGFVSKVTIEKSFGVVTGFEQALAKLQRFLEYQLSRFLSMHGQTGRWTLVVYVAREEQQEEVVECATPKASKSAK